MIDFIKLRKNYLISTLLFFIGVLLGWLVIPGASPIVDKNFHPIRQKGSFRFINPLLECDVGNPIEFKELASFRRKVQTKIDDYKNKGLVSYVSLYFRDLNNGPWFGIDPDADFSPASLLKVPLMIAYLRWAETDPTVLAKELKFDIEPDNQGVNIKASLAIEQGKTYTVDELLKYVISYSDNNAKNLLLLNIDQNILDKTYTDLGIAVPLDTQPEDFMSVKDYASFFRILFNASYLSKQSSEKALEFLSSVNFKQGLRAGVPENIVIAQKFGERAFVGSDVKQLHDCGIVYYPNYPYLICVMTRGNNFNNLGYAIKNISETIYDEVNSQHGNK